MYGETDPWTSVNYLPIWSSVWWCNIIRKRLLCQHMQDNTYLSCLASTYKVKQSELENLFISFYSWHNKKSTVVMLFPGDSWVLSFYHNSYLLHIKLGNNSSPFSVDSLHQFLFFCRVSIWRKECMTEAIYVIICTTLDSKMAENLPCIHPASPLFYLGFRIFHLYWVHCSLKRAKTAVHGEKTWPSVSQTRLSH